MGRVWPRVYVVTRRWSHQPASGLASVTHTALTSCIHSRLDTQVKRHGEAAQLEAGTTMRTVPFLWSVLVTVVWPPVSAGVSNLLGFRCGDRKSSVTLASYNTLVGDLCQDLEILFRYN